MTNQVKLTAISQHPCCAILIGDDLQFYFSGTTRGVFYGPFNSMTEADEARREYLKGKPKPGMFRTWLDLFIFLVLVLASAGAVISIGIALRMYFTN